MASDDIEQVRQLLVEAQIVALRNLNAKRAGAEVDYSASPMRGLTDLGLAERTAQGWSIISRKGYAGSTPASRTSTRPAAS